jgi:hypothetical protein
MVKKSNQKGGFWGLFGSSKSEVHTACVKTCDGDEEKRRQQQAEATTTGNADSAIPNPDVHQLEQPTIDSVGGYKKGSRSKTRKGRKDFVTHKGSKYYNRRGHRQTRNAKGKKGKPYKGGSGCHLTHKKKKRKQVKKARKSATKKHNKKHNKKHKKRGGTRRKGGCDTCGCK